MVIDRTNAISSNNIVLVRDDIDPVLADAIRSALLGMEGSDAGQAVLKGTKTVNYGETAPEVLATWEKTREMYLLIKD